MSPYENLPKRSFWKTGVAECQIAEISDLYAKKFDISAQTQIATAGSCFAQHIKRHMAGYGFNVLDVEPPPIGLTLDRQTAYGFGLFSARYGNLYTVRQLLQLAEQAFDQRRPVHAVWKKGERYVDGLRPAVEPLGFVAPEAVLLHRRNHLAKVRSLLERMDLMIFTFGLTEAWIDAADGTVYPTAPGTIATPAEPARIGFRNFTTSETMADFLAFRSLVRQRNPGCRFLLTVSPVPLTATAGDDHVLVATTYSKSVLRAAAGELAATLEDVDYFPSYELISSPVSGGKFFDANQRTVSPEGVRLVMNTFFGVHRPPERPAAAPAAVASSPAGEACEDALLEAFAR